MIRNIVTDLDTLRTKSTPAKPGDYTDKILRDLRDTLLSVDGVGLSAIQIGIPLRIAVVLLNDLILPLINPVFVELSEHVTNAPEGCLSLPGELVRIDRASAIVLKMGKRLIGLQGLASRVAQHEMDHFDGRLIID